MENRKKAPHISLEFGEMTHNRGKAAEGVLVGKGRQEEH